MRAYPYWSGTTVNIPYGKHIDVEGAICVASTSCGASSDGSASSKTRFTWTLPTDYTIRGSCVVSIDTACGGGMVIRNTRIISKLNICSACLSVLEEPFPPPC